MFKYYSEKCCASKGYGKAKRVATTTENIKLPTIEKKARKSTQIN
jgi:hypothetical protein